MNAQDILKYGHTFFTRTVDYFPKDHFMTPGVCGYWSAKDLTAHLASFELVLVEILENIVGPCPTPLVEEFAADGQAFNDHQVDELRRSLNMEQAMAEYMAAHERVRALTPRISAAQWEQEGILPWYGPEYDLEDFVVYSFYGHKREHGGQMQVWRPRS